MWDSAPHRYNGDIVCYIFHHWSGQEVDRSEIVVTSATGTPTPPQEYDSNGLPAWYLFRSVPRRLCPRSSDCGHCRYALGSVGQSGAQTPGPIAQGGYSFSM